MRFGIPLAVVLVSVSQFACSRGSPTDLIDDSDVLGTYTLKSVQDTVVPFTRPDSSKVLSGTFLFTADHKYSWTVYYQGVPSHPIHYYSGDGGEWTKHGDTLKFTSSIAPVGVTVAPAIYSNGQITQVGYLYVR